MAPFQFRLANLFPNSVSFVVFHNKLISGYTVQKKIKTFSSGTVKGTSSHSCYDMSNTVQFSTNH